MDLSEFEKLAPARGPECAVTVVLRQLPPAKRAKLREALARTENTSTQKRIPASAIVKWVRAQGFDIASDAVGRHRRKECRCG